MDRLEPIRPSRQSISRIDGASGLPPISADERRRQLQRRERAREQYLHRHEDEDYYDAAPDLAEDENGDDEPPGPHIDITA